MKKLTAAFLLLGGMIVMANKAMAALTDNLLIRVTPVGTKSVLITAAEYNFGNQDLGTSTMSLTAIDVENDGNVPETYSLQLNLAGGTGTTWTEGAAPGDNIFSFYAIFNAAAPAGLGSFTNRVLSASDTLSTGAVYAGDQTGVSVSPVAASDNRNLWFRLDMPLTSSVTAEQQFNVVVTAN